MSSRTHPVGRRLVRRRASGVFLVLGLTTAAPNAVAQNGSLRVTVPSPTAASLGKFGDIPVSLYTGTPDITVPLFVGVAARGGARIADKAAGFLPVASTVQDATAVFRGRTLDGDALNTIDRSLAVVGLLTPLSGAQLRSARAGVEAIQSGRGSLRGIATWGNPKTLDDHFGRHGGDFGAAYKSAEEYAQGASDFLKRSQAEGLPTKVADDGTIRIYEPSTNTFASYNPDGTTKTFFKPDPSKHGYRTNMDYWKAQPPQEP